MKQNFEKKSRNSNIELLRIISMIFIIISHYTVHNNYNLFGMPIGFNRYILEVAILGNIGVWIYILITGYFMCESNKVKISKLFKLYFQILFYSLVIYMLFCLFGDENFSLKGLIKNMFPITFKVYWFATAYAILYLLTPFLNKMIQNMTRKEHFKFNLMYLLIFSIIRTFTNQDFYCSQLVEFIFIYSIGAYLRLYPDNIFNRKANNKKIFIISTILLLSSTLILDLLGLKIKILQGHSQHFFNRHSILVIMFSISLFSIFINKKECTNKIINKLAGCTFGIYLIHDNPYIRKFLWIDLFKNAQYVNSKYMIIHLIFSVSIVYISCTIIEYIRQKIMTRFLKKLQKIDKPFENVIDKGFEILK